jgi:hypothetical protein
MPAFSWRLILRDAALICAVGEGLAVVGLLGRALLRMRMEEVA